MPITLLATVKNEEKLLPFWLRYWTPIAQRIIALDNESTDGTAAILKANPKVEYIRFGKGDNLTHDSQRMQMLYDTSASVKSGWVIIADVDEYFWHKDGLHYTLTNTPSNIQAYESIGIHPTFKSFPKDTGQNLVDTTVLAAQGGGKPTVFRAGTNIKWVMGCHALQDCNVTLAKEKLIMFHYIFFGEAWSRYRANRYALSPENLKYGWGVPQKNEEKNVKYYHDSIASERPWKELLP